ncbi:DUF4179 domain-containing protein [Clostridium intestinale]|uniref:DUF4179 domain-containing protein n=1 Tax=Clostridium intestinale TaxID=36845 RepID=UPI0028E7221E|nr:DUF4179 domain-containing protein [Clostridium intestinale]
MSSFDEHIKNKINKEDWAVPKTLDDKLSKIIDELPSEPKSINSISYRKIAAAAVVTLTILLAFNSSSVKAAVSNVIEYFNINKNSEYVGEASTFQEFNNSIGISAEDKGIKLTIDNIVADDSFLNIFYTAESKEDIPRSEYEDYWSAFEAQPSLGYKINGKETVNGGSNNGGEAYLESNKVLRGISRFDISQEKIDSKFNIEISTDRVLKTEGNWSIKTSVDKSKTVAASRIITPNKAAVVNNGVKNNNLNIDKVVFSPLGNQIVITEYTDEDSYSFNSFAIEDSKGNRTAAFSQGFMGTDGSKITNSFEFIGIDRDTDYINIIPIDSNIGRATDSDKIDIKNLPLTIKINEYGSIIIDDIIFSNNQIKVKFRKSGIVPLSDEFKFYDKEGNEVIYNDGVLEHFVDRTTGVYTTTYTSYKDVEDFSKYAKLSVIYTGNMKLLEDQKIRVDLK